MWRFTVLPLLFADSGSLVSFASSNMSIAASLAFLHNLIGRSVLLLMLLVPRGVRLLLVGSVRLWRISPPHEPEKAFCLLLPVAGHQPGIVQHLTVAFQVLIWV